MSTATHAAYVLRGNPVTAIAATGTLLLLLIAVAAPGIVPFDPIASNVRIALQPPDALHWAGTDQLGRDILSRIIAATRLDLAIAASAVSLSFAAGAVIGGFCGYRGGRLDRWIGRFVDVLMAFPLFVLAMALVAALGNRVENVIIATAIINLPFYIRFARAEVNVRRNAGWVEAARACGEGHLSVVLRILLPNILPAMAVQISLNLGWAILNAAGLSFIGLGVTAPTPEWGIMVAEGARFITTGKWWLVALPGLALMLTVLCFNLLGDGLRDILDPHAKLMLLEVEGLQVSFATRHGRVVALHGIDLAIDRGETLGIVGESGSGKSVTSLAVMRLLDRAGRIDAGRIGFDGADITHASHGSLRRLRGSALSMIFQNPRVALNPIRTVQHQIADVLRAHDKQPSRGRVLELLNDVRIRDPERRLHAYPHELSGGMCQRVMIAMAIACEPALLIADEPTTGLDVTTQQTVMELLAAIKQARGMALVLITHDLGLAARWCDRIAVMEQGRVVETGPTAALFEAPDHAYTRRLVAASPTRRSTLSDLTPASSHPSSPPSSSDSIRGCTPFGHHQPAASNRAVAPKNPPGTPPLLELLDLTKSFDGHKAVDTISLQIPQAGALGLVGESGSGKSTLSRLITRLIDPDSGDIVFNGESIGDTPARDFHRHPARGQIQIVFQDPHDSLNPRDTAFDSIAHPLRRLLHMRDGAALTTRVRDTAQRCGLPLDLLDRFPHQLSGGQKARIGIARAIAPGPRLLVLDEPTAALDVSVQAVILQLLDRLRREDGIGLLFVSHDLNVVRMLCEQLVVLQLGQVVEAGPSADIFASPKAAYTRLLLDAIPYFEPSRAPARPVLYGTHP